MTGLTAEEGGEMNGLAGRYFFRCFVVRAQGPLPKRFEQPRETVGQAYLPGGAARLEHPARREAVAFFQLVAERFDPVMDVGCGVLFLHHRFLRGGGRSLSAPVRPVFRGEQQGADQQYDEE